MSRQFTYFVLASGVAAVANIAARWVLSLALPYDLAIVLAYCCGMAVAFVLNRNLVFTARGGEVRRQVMRFVIVNVVSVAQVWGVSVLLFRFVFPSIGFYWHNETVAHSIGVASPVFTSYFAHRYYSFAGSVAVAGDGLPTSVGSRPEPPN